MKINKERRHLYIKKILADHDVETQEQLVELLNKHGMGVTQATVSRDIREMNLVKTPANDGKTKYTFIDNKQKQHNVQLLQKKVQDVLIKIEKVDNLILLKTIPANAHVLGALIDSMDWSELAGTVCGNDTCLLIVRTPEDTDTIIQRLTPITH